MAINSLEAPARRGVLRESLSQGQTVQGILQLEIHRIKKQGFTTTCCLENGGNHHILEDHQMLVYYLAATSFKIV